MSRTSNKLTIRTNSLDIDLRGEPAEVSAAYGSMRSQLFEQFFDTMNYLNTPGEATVELPQLQPNADQTAGADTGEEFVNLVICSDIYDKMYLIDEVQFQQSFLSDILRGPRLGRIYVDSRLEATLREHVDIGSALWRELTTTGKAAIGRGD